MKLAIITPRYPKENDPYNHMFVHVRAKYFKELGNEVVVFVPSSEQIFYNYQGIEVKQMSNRDIIQQYDGYDLLYLHLVNNYFLIKSGGYPIYKDIQKNKRTFAIYIHGSEILKYPDYLFDFSFSLKGILKYFYLNYWNSIKIAGFLKESNQRKNATFIFPSKWMKQHTESIIKFKLNNCNVIPNGIDTNMFKFVDSYKNRHKLLMIRPLTDLKYGFDIAIEILRFLPSEFKLTIYGKGKYERYCRKLIDSYRLAQRVVMINKYIERHEIPNVFKDYGGFIATTRFDSQGVIMCEAMASGLLTVSNNVTAIPEFIEDNKNGILADTPKEIANKIVEAVSNQEKYRMLTLNARTRMESISIEKMGEKENNVLSKLIKSQCVEF
ncbi:MAG: glycosyltransferase family 4 protein [Weeksellaceae bacterium]|jgi:glycosyltransferase involved in cell wall biosynthesis|nr:glycosyltransferase family 4 protein [Weeksellaceae bacterium]